MFQGRCYCRIEMLSMPLEQAHFPTGSAKRSFDVCPCSRLTLRSAVMSYSRLSQVRSGQVRSIRSVRSGQVGNIRLITPASDKKDS